MNEWSWGFISHFCRHSIAFSWSISIIGPSLVSLPTIGIFFECIFELLSKFTRFLKSPDNKSSTPSQTSISKSFIFVSKTKWLSFVFVLKTKWRFRFGKIPWLGKETERKKIKCYRLVAWLVVCVTLCNMRIQFYGRLFFSMCIFTRRMDADKPKTT